MKQEGSLVKFESPPLMCTLIGSFVMFLCLSFHTLYFFSIMLIGIYKAIMDSSKIYDEKYEFNAPKQFIDFSNFQDDDGDDSFFGKLTIIVHLNTTTFIT